MIQYYTGNNTTEYMPFDKLYAISHYIVPNFATLDWDAVSRQQVSESMTRLRDDRDAVFDDLMMYIHIPYCKSFCHYCNFNKNHYPFKDESILDEYVSYVIKEIDYYLAQPYIQSRNLTSIYIGGGSPSTLPTKSVARLFEHLQARLPNYAAIEKSFTGESRTLRREDLLQLIHDHGWQRVTFGIESLNPSIHRAIGRWDRREDIDAVFSGLDKLGYKGEKCVDLMYDLPGQTLQGFADELTELVDVYSPDEIDAFGTVYLPYRPLHKLIIEGRVDQPGDGWQLLQMREQLYDYLLERGYHNTIAETYAKSRHKSKYQTAHCARQDIVAIGCAGRGNLKDMVCINPSDVSEWKKNIDEYGYSTSTLQSIGRDGVLERIMAMFPRYLYLEKARLHSFKDASSYNTMVKVLRDHIKRGVVEEHEDSYSVNKLGVLWHGNMQTEYMLPRANLRGRMLLNVLTEDPRKKASQKPRFAVNAATRFIAENIDKYPKLMK